MKLNQSKSKNISGKNFKIGIILARFNDILGNELLQNTKESLLTFGIPSKNIHDFQVPGALEIPFLAQKLAQSKKFDVIISLGIVIKGKTAHFDYVCRESYRALMDINLQEKTPIIFGILTVMNEKQAKERVQKNKMNKGKEYAEAAVEMANLAKKTL